MVAVTRTPKRELFETDRYVPWKDESGVISSPHAEERESLSPGAKEYAAHLRKGLGLKEERIFSFAPTKFEKSKRELTLEMMADLERPVKKMKASEFRHISTDPTKILDLPDVKNDYYANVMDWSPDNVVSIGLGNSTYLWDGESGETIELDAFEVEDNEVSCTKFNPVKSSILNVCADFGEIKLYDVSEGRCIRNLKGHVGRVNVSAWNENILATGGKDSSILFHDIRVKQHLVRKLSHHAKQVSSLSWSHDGYAFASSGEDGYAFVLDTRKDYSVIHEFNGHKGCVKGLAWSRDSLTLATGGGVNDGYVKLWNTYTGTQIGSKYLGGPVSSIVFNQQGDEIAAVSGKEINLLRNPELSLCKKFEAHTGKIMSMNLSPCGVKIATCSSDETLKFWDVFEKPKKLKQINITPEYEKFSKIR